VKRGLAIALVAVAVAACAHSNAPVATEADATRAQTRWPGITVAELNHGRKIYLGRCGSCHLPPEPSAYAVEAWPGHVREMAERAGLAGDDATAVIRYVQVMAGAP
jgi:hypothetical protein